MYIINSHIRENDRFRLNAWFVNTWEEIQNRNELKPASLVKGFWSSNIDNELRIVLDTETYPYMDKYYGVLNGI